MSNSSSSSSGIGFWATNDEQAMNKSRSLRFEWLGEIRSLPQIAKMEGVNPRRIHQSVKKYKLPIAVAIQRAKSQIKAA